MAKVPLTPRDRRIRPRARPARRHRAGRPASSSPCCGCRSRRCSTAFCCAANSTSPKYRSPRSSRWRRRTTRASFRCRCFRRACSATRRSTFAADGGIDRPEQLAGKRVGVPEWAQTAAIYSRGLLAHEYGVDLASIHWHQAGVNEPGRQEKVALALPAGFRLTVVADRSLSDMLLAGDLDAVLSARPPAPFDRGDPRVRRLFADYRDVEARVRAQDRHLPDHARGRDAARNLRARPLAGDEPVQGIRPGTEAQPRARGGHDGIVLSAAVDTGRAAPRARALRRRSVAVRDRGQPARRSTRSCATRSSRGSAAAC